MFLPVHLATEHVVAVAEEDLVRIVIEMIVKCLEEFNRFVMMRVPSPRWLGLAWSVHGNVLRVTLHERLPVLGIPSIV
jgi:hypothetical protein